MKKIMMIAAMRYSETDGISKKICMQAKALSNKNKKCILICLAEYCNLLIEYENGEQLKRKFLSKYISDEGIGGIAHEKLMLSDALTILKNDSFDVIYIRHMLPQHELILFLKYAKKNRTKLAYEIPTYPYYREQLNVSNNKAKTIVKLTIESVYWPIIYQLIDKLVVIRCSDKARVFEKMQFISNGYSGIFSHREDEVNCRDINMIGVGTIYHYHGYDKIIYNMEKCGCKSGKSNIFFHIIGESDEISRLKKYVNEHKLEKNVLFYGKRYGNELTEIYKKCNLGIGTMALSLRGANIDTAIKNIEYFANDLPVITSGVILGIPLREGLYYIQDENKPMNFNELREFISAFYLKNNRKALLDAILREYTWETIMDKVLEGLE